MDFRAAAISVWNRTRARVEPTDDEGELVMTSAVAAPGSLARAEK
jgi:hypothetical protein